MGGEKANVLVYSGINHTNRWIIIYNNELIIRSDMSSAVLLYTVFGLTLQIVGYRLDLNVENKSVTINI